MAYSGQKYAENTDGISMAEAVQKKSREWHAQWSMFRDEERFLFNEWIYPASLEDMAGRDVLECGCGGGQHTAFIAEVAASVTATDLNTVDIARQRNRDKTNVTFVEADIAAMDLGRQFDVVVCIGVIHHTDNPNRTFENLYRHCKDGGLMIIWTTAAEGNALYRYMLEPLRKLVLRHLPRSAVAGLSRLITVAVYPVVHTVYRLPFMSFLPYYDYFRGFRRLSFERNVLNVFDKLNAPQVHFTTRQKANQWFSEQRFAPETICIRHHAGISYTLVGRKRKR